MVRIQIRVKDKLYKTILRLKKDWQLSSDAEAVRRLLEYGLRYASGNVREYLEIDRNKKIELACLFMTDKQARKYLLREVKGVEYGNKEHSEM